MDAAATVSADGYRIALTLVNRDPVEAQEIEVEPARINGEQVPTKGSTLTFTLPAQSFTLVEVALG